MGAAYGRRKIMSQCNSLQLAGIKLVFGCGACRTAAEELEKAGADKPLIITDQGILESGLLDNLTDALKERRINYEIFSGVESDPSAEICMRAAECIRESGADSCIGVGGGSAMDTAKAAKVLVNNEGTLFDYDNSPSGGKKFRHRGLFTICVPTTSGTGCEVTPYVIITNTQKQRKATVNSPFLLADVALIDPELTLHMPPALTAATGMDALAHAIGGYTSARSIHAGGSTILSDTLELKAIQLIGENLREDVQNGTSLEARLNMMMASTIGGIVISAGGDASHGLGHALGAVYHVPHGTACAMMMPYVMEYNLKSCPGRFAKIAEALGADIVHMTEDEAAQAAVDAVRSLIRDIGIPHLKEYVDSVNDEKFERLCETAAEEKCSILNPRPITKETARKLFLRAYEQMTEEK